jgi:hypothetical protein
MAMLKAAHIAPFLPTAIAIACSSGGGGMTAPGADATQDGVDGGSTMTATIDTEIEQIDGFGANHPRVGDNVVLALDGQGRPSVAYGSVPKTGGPYEIWYALRDSSGMWMPEKAIVPGAHVSGTTGQITGLGFAYASNVPQIAYLGGGTDMNPLTPYPTDLMLARRSGGMWTEQTLASMASDATCTCPMGSQNYCQFGNVVGGQTAMKARPGGGGYAIAYQNTHNGFAHDDQVRADADVYAVGGPVMNVCVDPDRSGGQLADITYTKNNNLVIAYNLFNQTGAEMRTGVWAGAYDGSIWHLAHVSSGLSLSRLALGTAQSGTIYMAIADSDNVDLLVATSTTNGLTWKLAPVDQAGKTGVAPSIAFDKMDRPVIAYEYCGRQSDTDCPGTPSPRAEIRLARLEGTAWKIYKLEDGQGFGHVGVFTSIAVTPDGKIGVAYVDDMNGSLLYVREK